jgi:hypothetical protein
LEAFSNASFAFSFFFATLNKLATTKQSLIKKTHHNPFHFASKKQFTNTQTQSLTSFFIQKSGISPISTPSCKTEFSSNKTKNTSKQNEKYSSPRNGPPQIFTTMQNLKNPTLFLLTDMQIIKYFQMGRLKFMLTINPFEIKLSQ